MPPALRRTVLLFLALLCAAASLLCFVLACAAALHGALWPTLGWLAGSALGATGFVLLPALGGAALWQARD